MNRVVIMLFAGILCTSVVAAASDQLPSQTTLQPSPNADGPAAVELEPPFVHPTGDHRATRPLVWSFLYGTNVALQGFDAYSTLKALDGRATEQNRMIKSVAGSPAAFIAVKAGATALAIVAAERLRTRHHPVAAILLILGSNSLMMCVALNNARVLANR